MTRLTTLELRDAAHALNIRNRIEPPDPDYPIGRPVNRRKYNACATCAADLGPDDYGMRCKSCRLTGRAAL